MCAVWNDQAKVQIWNLNPCVESVQKQQEQDEAPGVSKKKSMNVKAPPKGKTAVKPLFSFVGHPSEGFALDWSPVSQGE